MAEHKLKEIVKSARSCLQKILQQIYKNNESNTKVGLYEISGATACGAVSFPLCMGTFQSTIFRPLRLTCNRPLAALFGCASVALSGSIASMVFISYLTLIDKIPSNITASLKDRYFYFLPELTGRIPFSFDTLDIPLFAVSSLVVFKVLGGRFRSALPSSLLHPGAFAKNYFPAASQNYASSFVKHKLLREGRKHGCHSCGRRWSKLFVGDHMPPNKLVKPGQKQRFYPQCRKCSYQQGAAITHSSKRLAVKTHGSSLRLHHLWLPVPLGLMTLGGFPSRNSAKDSQLAGNATQETDTKLSIVTKNTNESTAGSNLQALGLRSTKEICSGNDEKKQE